MYRRASVIVCINRQSTKGVLATTVPTSWQASLSQFLRIHMKHRDPHFLQVERMLTLLCRHQQAEQLHNLLSWLDSPTSYLLSNGLRLATEYSIMLAGASHWCELGRILQGPHGSVIPSAVRHTAISELCKAGEWKTAVKLFVSSPGLHPMPRSFQAKIPPQYFYQVQIAQRLVHYLRAFYTSRSSAHVPTTPLIKLTVLQHALQLHQWRLAAEFFNPLTAPKSFMPVNTQNNRTLSHIAFALESSQWRQWIAILRPLYSSLTWNHLVCLYPNNTNILLCAGRWIEALGEITEMNTKGAFPEENFPPSIQAAVRAGVWKAAFHFHRVTHLIRTFEDLPFPVCASLISKFGHEWRSAGDRLIHRLDNEAFVPFNEKRINAIRVQNLKRLGKLEGVPPDPRV